MGEFDTAVLIRLAQEADARELLNIYAPYVTDTAVSFEYEVPSVAEFSRRIRDTLQRYPYLVALENSRIIGYAYAAAFKKRTAYAWAVETTIYLKTDYRRKGLGKKLYLALEDILKQQNILNLNACIAFTPKEDPYLDNSSMLFHEHLGYRKVGHFTQCGYKFGAWYDMIWMEKILGEHPEHPQPVVPLPELSAIIQVKSKGVG